MSFAEELATLTREAKETLSKEDINTIKGQLENSARKGCTMVRLFVGDRFYEKRETWANWAKREGLDFSAINNRFTFSWGE